MSCERAVQIWVRSGGVAGLEGLTRNAHGVARVAVRGESRWRKRKPRIGERGKEVARRLEGSGRHIMWVCGADLSGVDATGAARQAVVESPTWTSTWSWS